VSVMPLNVILDRPCNCNASKTGPWADVHAPGCGIFKRAWQHISEAELRGIAEKMYRVLATLEDIIDKQTYDEFRRAEFDLPDDAELNIDLQAKIIREISRAVTMAEKETK